MLQVHVRGVGTHKFSSLFDNWQSWVSRRLEIKVTVNGMDIACHSNSHEWTEVSGEEVLLIGITIGTCPEPICLLFCTFCAYSV
jgi:hypothetical protein